MDDLKKDLTRFESKLDKISEDISQIKVVQGEQAQDIRYHIARTDQIEDKLLPLVEIKYRFEGAFKLVGMCATILGLIFGALKAVEMIINLI